MISLPNPTMPVTFTENYREIFTPATLDHISFLESQNFFLDDMLVFIDEHSEEKFRDFYEEYVRLGEEYGFDAIDFFIERYDFEDLQYFERAYIGWFRSESEFCEEFFPDLRGIDYRIAINYEGTVAFLEGEGDIVKFREHYFHGNW